MGLIFFIKVHLSETLFPKESQILHVHSLRIQTVLVQETLEFNTRNKETIINNLSPGSSIKQCTLKTNRPLKDGYPWIIFSVKTSSLGISYGGRTSHPSAACANKAEAARSSAFLDGKFRLPRRFRTFWDHICL